MYQKDQICDKIRSVYPDVGRCGIDIRVDFDKKNKAWAVLLKNSKGALNFRVPFFMQPID